MAIHPGLPDKDEVLAQDTPSRTRNSVSKVVSFNLFSRSSTVVSEDEDSADDFDLDFDLDPGLTNEEKVEHCVSMLRVAKLQIEHLREQLGDEDIMSKTSSTRSGNFPRRRRRSQSLPNFAENSIDDQLECSQSQRQSRTLEVLELEEVLEKTRTENKELEAQLSDMAQDNVNLRVRLKILEKEVSNSSTLASSVHQHDEHTLHLGSGDVKPPCSTNGETHLAEIQESPSLVSADQQHPRSHVEEELEEAMAEASELYRRWQDLKVELVEKTSSLEAERHLNLELQEMRKTELDAKDACIEAERAQNAELQRQVKDLQETVRELQVDSPNHSRSPQLFKSPSMTSRETADTQGEVSQDELVNMLRRDMRKLKVTLEDERSPSSRLYQRQHTGDKKAALAEQARHSEALRAELAERARHLETKEQQITLLRAQVEELEAEQLETASWKRWRCEHAEMLSCSEIAAAAGHAQPAPEQISRLQETAENLMRSRIGSLGVSVYAQHLLRQIGSSWAELLSSVSGGVAQFVGPSVSSSCNLAAQALERRLPRPEPERTWQEDLEAMVIEWCVRHARDVDELRLWGSPEMWAERNKTYLDCLVANGWSSEDALLVGILKTGIYSQPMARALRDGDSAYAAVTYKLIDVSVKNLCWQQKVAGAAPKLYRNLRGEGSLIQGDPAWQVFLTPEATGCHSLVTSAAVFPVRADDAFHEQGFIAGDDTKPQEGDIVCFESACTDEHGLMHSAIMTVPHEGMFPPNTLFTLKEIKQAGTWSAEGSLCSHSVGQRLLVVTATFPAPEEKGEEELTCNGQDRDAGTKTTVLVQQRTSLLCF